MRSNSTPRLSTPLRAVCAGAAAACLFGVAHPSAAGDAYAANPAPRYVSLGADLANGREGPSRDHRIVWIYQRRGLPLKVVEEWQGWRKVEDPFGDQTWLMASMLQRQRTVYVIGDEGHDAALRQGPNIESRVRANVARGVIAELRDCSRGWCEVKVDGIKGWMPRRALWGADSTRSAP
ncbi:MAG: SH3 domain-containing protein [Caulobacterales bacterium]